MTLTDHSLAIAASLSIATMLFGAGIWWERQRPGGTEEQRDRLRLARRQRDAAVSRERLARNELAERRRSAMHVHPASGRIPVQRDGTVDVGDVERGLRHLHLARTERQQVGS